MGFTVDTPKGKLVVVDLFSPTSAEEAKRLANNLGLSLKARSGACVLVTDLRGLKRLDPETIEAYRRVLVSDNSLVIRAGLIAQPSADALQFYRTVQESENPNRKIFTKGNELEKWVGKHLVADEKAALKRFLSLRS